VSLALGFLLGWFAYHLLMNRAVMMRECCVQHFSTHNVCPCRDCREEWSNGRGASKPSREGGKKSDNQRGAKHPDVAASSAASTLH
jgi:hypothetical protein